ncbi:hypothetical protein [Cutibacterium sp.]|nr:hypothetical protein [Cutibacterium sp.]MDO4412866.1 hypothetical protein [Cutibacterium sp.]
MKSTEDLTAFRPSERGSPTGLVATSFDKPLDELAAVVHALFNKN